MDKIVEERNGLQDEITNVIQYNDQQNPLIEQIDAWQKSTIEKVKQVAAQARQQASEPEVQNFPKNRKFPPPPEKIFPRNFPKLFYLHCSQINFI
jgi:hypothetical protein